MFPARFPGPGHRQVLFLQLRQLIREPARPVLVGQQSAGVLQAENRLAMAQVVVAGVGSEADCCLAWRIRATISILRRGVRRHPDEAHATGATSSRRASPAGTLALALCPKKAVYSARGRKRNYRYIHIIKAASSTRAVNAQIKSVHLQIRDGCGP